MTERGPGSLTRLRGRAVVAVRRVLTEPLRRRFPVDGYRTVHRGVRSIDAKRWTDADPFAVRWIDPAAVEWSLLESAPSYPQWGRVEGGEWYRSVERFADRRVPLAIVARFADGRPWEETPLREAFADQLRRFGNAWGYTSMDGFEARAAEIDRLYDSINENGYHRSATVLDEINVDVGPDGGLHWRCYGQHRLAIARVLDLDAVPALVHRRHRDWQATREAARRGDPVERPDHPDLVDCHSRRGP